MTDDLFASDVSGQRMGEGSLWLRGFALPWADALIADIGRLREQVEFRQMTTPGGHRMSAWMLNCGTLGWVTDRRGYRYTRDDPETGRPWPAMPDSFRSLAVAAAAEAGFSHFEPDACLVNRYDVGARMALHQDKNEQDYAAPIVSVSLGLPMTFLFGGLARSDKPAKLQLHHGDVVVWGGPDRLRYHGVLTLKAGEHPELGPHRINLTFRKAG
ncbi:MAG: DNA oxidative demethylase AlkB [Marinobacter sp.]|nr:DNA oxidative demethylase AlkB [Marinobacter sp.]